MFNVQPLRQKKANLSFNPFPSGAGLQLQYEYASVEVVGKVKYQCLACPVEMPCHDTVVTCRWVSGLRLDGQCELSCEVGGGWAKEHR